MLAGAYLVGSVPTSVWLGKAFKGTDLREYGSGNAGATNAFRVLGIPLGISVLLLDILKGYAAVSLSHLQNQLPAGGSSWMYFRAGLGAFAVTGHIFPLFAGFRGGKGVATLAGIGLALHPYSALASLGVYLLVFLFSRLSALGSLVAVTSYPIWMIFVFRSGFTALWIFSISVPVLVFITHRKNLSRLLKGEEQQVIRKEPGS